VDLVAVVDPRPAARRTVADENQTRAFEDYHALLHAIDAAVIAAPTSLHAAIARRLIDAKVHVLVEKPLASSHQACDLLTQSARANGVVLAVGHVERFNPAFVAAQQQAIAPVFIEAVRTSGFSFRSLDVGVVLDLMIHDLELVLALVDSQVVSVSAVGLPVVTSHEDLAEARVRFSNGCVAEFKASRTSPVGQRQMSIFGCDRHLFVDFSQRRANVLRRCQELQQGTLHIDHLAPAEVDTLRQRVFQTLLPTTELTVADTNPLRDELLDFVASIRQQQAPRVDGTQAARAVWLAEQIVGEIQRQLPHPARPSHRRAA
jgi:predicted dehydrogenase